MKKIGRYWVDEYNNRWDCDQFTEDDASHYSGDEGRGCTDCIDCVFCENCHNCLACKDCDSCVNCQHCDQCSNCVDCSGCNALQDFATSPFQFSQPHIRRETTEEGIELVMNESFDFYWTRDGHTQVCALDYCTETLEEFWADVCKNSKSYDRDEFSELHSFYHKARVIMQLKYGEER